MEINGTKITTAGLLAMALPKTYMQQRREEHAARGICIQCFTDPARPRLKTCLGCYEMDKGRKRSGQHKPGRVKRRKELA